MTQDFEELLRQAIDSDEVEIPANTEQAIAAGRRIVRGRRIGWGLGASAVVAAAVLVLPGLLQRPVAAVPAQTHGDRTASPAPADGWLIGTEWSVVRLGGGRHRAGNLDDAEVRGRHRHRLRRLQRVRLRHVWPNGGRRLVSPGRRSA